jgi:hypothetical protein
MKRFAWVVVVVSSFIGCSHKSEQAASTGSGGAPYLTVGAYCTAFCTKLCATCGIGDCSTSCNRRCDYGRSPDLVFDGKDPKVALALTQQNLDACLATITKDSCMSIASANIPPACYTIQH